MQFQAFGGPQVLSNVQMTRLHAFETVDQQACLKAYTCTPYITTYLATVPVPWLSEWLELTQAAWLSQMVAQLAKFEDIVSSSLSIALSAGSGDHVHL